MSVTFTIRGNDDYCHRHSLAVSTPSVCQCCYPDGKDPVPDCPGCKGTGDDGFGPSISYPFEMNLANGNARTLLAALALPCESDLCGFCDGRLILSLLRQTEPQLVQRASSQSVGRRGAKLIECGIGADQADRYFKGLAEIAEEAARREEPVTWS